MAYLIKEVIH